ncbi:MAG: type IV pilus assembly protein PilM [Limisphaerales bacterium]
MLNSKSFLAVDFGAGSLKLAEFEVNEAGGLRLKQYGLKSLGAEGAQDSTREAAIQKALQELLTEKGIKARSVNVCAPGFHVFSKFVKLPPVDAGKVTQIIQYEAQQNVPFPLAEVVWDYQILGTTPGGELEVLLVAIKADIVEGLFRVTEGAGLRLQLADVSPAALCNAFRYNYGDLEDCTMLLDIGAKTSNLLFFEKGKVFSRSINLGANSITHDFATEAKLKFEAAEKLKINEGFVSLGGAYEEPENPHQAAISKIARQFMTRLHIQVNQTMQFYRGQQGGSAPQRLFLSGGASLMPYTAQFFAEKLNVPVEYFNPLRNVQLDPSINLEDLARVAHSLGEVVGLGLRNLAQCPVELNLMPESTLRWQSFNQKKPYLLASAISMAAVVFLMGVLFDQLAEAKNKSWEDLHKRVEPALRKQERFTVAYNNLKKTEDQINQVVEWMGDRYYWLDVLKEMRQALIRVEADTKSNLGTDAGIWIDSLNTFTPDAETMAGDAAGRAALGAASPAASTYDRYRTRPLGAAPTAAGAPATVSAKARDPNTIDNLDVTFRAVSLASLSEKVQADANQVMAYAVQAEMRSSALFDPTNTKLASIMGVPEDTGTFTFKMNIQLKRPLKL